MDVRLDIPHDLLQHRDHLIGIFDVRDHLRVAVCRDVDIPHLEPFVRKPHFEVHALDLRIKEVAHVYADHAAPEQHAPVGQGVFGIFLGAARGGDVRRPYPYGNEVQREKHADERDGEGRQFLEHPQPDHRADKAAVEEQPDEREGQHATHPRRDIRRAFGLSPPQNGFVLREHIFQQIVFHRVAFFEVAFVKNSHFFLPFLFYDTSRREKCQPLSPFSIKSGRVLFSARASFFIPHPRFLQRSSPFFAPRPLFFCPLSRRKYSFRLWVNMS